MVLPHPACSAELSRYFDALQRGAAEAYRVAVVPTVAVFRNGRVSARLDGVLGRGLLRGELEAFLEANRGRGAGASREP